MDGLLHKSILGRQSDASPNDFFSVDKLRGLAVCARILVSMVFKKKFRAVGLRKFLGCFRWVSNRKMESRGGAEIGG